MCLVSFRVLLWNLGECCLWGFLLVDIVFVMWVIFDWEFIYLVVCLLLLGKIIDVMDIYI